jgi:hypothetical protein
MNRTLLVLVVAATLLAACTQNKAADQASAAAQAAASQPAATPAAAPAKSDAMQQKVSETAGGGAKDCGRPSSNDRAALDSAASCVMDAAQAKKPFTIVYDMPGMSVAVAGNSEGKLFSLQQVQPETGPKGEVNVTPCPAELRVAQSGRVTCFPAGTMGVPPGAANPHAGTASGASPHGGMGMPAAGTPNPHAGNMTTRPPSKTPPQ